MTRTRTMLPRDDGAHRLRSPISVAVVGGGIAGVAAATVLAERGAHVRLIERESFIGGRAGSWDDSLKTGERFQMERGFHAFFRQYYNLRNLLRRIDPELSLLTPVDDYPIYGPAGAQQSFSGLPTTPPFNLLAVARRTSFLRLADLVKVNGKAALEMLAYDDRRTHEAHDQHSAAEFLDSLRFPDQAREMLFSVFAHSFFNPEKEMSAAELLMMFHFYFIGNREGLIFDVVDRPFAHAIWDPFAVYLRDRGVEISLSRNCDRLERGSSSRWRVVVGDRTHEVDAVVLATTVPGLQAIVDSSPHLGANAWRQRLAKLQLTRPFAVWRVWLDRPTDPARHPFVGTTGLGYLDNISIFHDLEDESRAWAKRTGGSVVELHAYAVEPTATEDALKASMLRSLHELYPETRDAKVIEERFLLRQDCPAFPPGISSYQPTVQTEQPGLCLAGDFVRLPFPSALMERAAASGILAANHLLAERGVRPEPLETIAQRGLLARFRRRRAA